MDNNNIATTFIKLLGINIGNGLNFDEHLWILCSKAAMQLNALYWPHKYMGKLQKKP